jgi:hypothetical protein
MLDWLRDLRDNMAHAARGVPSSAWQIGLAVLGAAALTAFLILVVGPAVSCSFPGGDDCAPADEAAEVVPADSLAYVHVDLDQDSEQFQAAASVTGGLPLISRQVEARLLGVLAGPTGAPPDYEKDLKPWFGGEVAIALLPAGRAAEQVQLLEVSDEPRAKRYADSLGAGAPNTTPYHGVGISVDPRGLATAVTGGFLVVGTESGVRQIVDVATGVTGARPLADDSNAEAVRDRLPDDRLADAYVSPAGAKALLAGERGPFATFEPFVDQAATTGAAAALVAKSDGFELAIRSDLDEEKEKKDPGFFGAFPAFSPELPEKLSPKTLAYAGFGAPSVTVRSLLAQASAQAPGLAAGLGDVAERLKELGKVDIRKDLLPALGNEAALALQQTVGDEAQGKAPLPFLQFIASDVDEQATREALARLQAPILDALQGPGEGAPAFGEIELGGEQAQAAQVSPTVKLTYAVFDSLLVVATDTAGVAQVAKGEGGLGGDDAFRAATDGFSDEASLVAYLNLASLLRLAEVNGLAESPAYATFAPELGRLETFGLSVDSSLDALDTDAKLVINSPDKR